MLLVRYGEIGLKGQNRPLFENQLVRNIKSKLGNVKIEKDSGSILVYSHDSFKVKEIFGISWCASVTETGLSLKEMQGPVLNILEEKKPKTFRITANRSNKSFPIKSQDLAREIGKACEEKGFEASLKDAELEIFVDILKDRALIYTEKQEGPGGLPVGTSGKVLCLLSGGIDSPVAAFLMAKRGCSVDYLHFYALRDYSEVGKSKIPKLV
ncbi:MAG TPA: THUMP domain-containing protein, partial [Candidatus Nanoarchaeia archaeon]|nr:THUMP domain-containing protein [Candidatus Nanoarchaeia archaeon]